MLNLKVYTFKLILKVLGKVYNPARDYLIKIFPGYFFIPHMSIKEYKLLNKYAKKGENVIEYGSGGSTFFFLKQVKNVLSVENNKDFFEYMKSIKTLENKKLIYNYVDIGETEEWGFPKNKAKIENWPKYYNNPWLEHIKFKPNLVFIDGRFRVMCALKTVQHVDKSTKIIIHDFTDRDHYQDILNFYKIVDSVDTMVVLQPKETIDVKKLSELEEMYKTDFR